MNELKWIRARIDKLESEATPTAVDAQPWDLQKLSTEELYELKVFVERGRPFASTADELLRLDAMCRKATGEPWLAAGGSR